MISYWQKFPSVIPSGVNPQNVACLGHTDVMHQRNAFQTGKQSASRNQLEEWNAQKAARRLLHVLQKEIIKNINAKTAWREETVLWFLVSKQLCVQPLIHSWKSSSYPELPFRASSASQQDCRALISLLSAYIYRQENKIKHQYQQIAFIRSRPRFTHLTFMEPALESADLSGMMGIKVESGF